MAMKNKLIFIALGFIVAGVLVYFLVASDRTSERAPAATRAPLSAVPPSSSVAPPVRQPPAAGYSAPGDSGTSPATAQPADHPGADSPPGEQPPPLEPEIREALGKILNTSSEGLVEETHNGVTGIDLKGHFKTAPVATIDEHGNVQVTDYSHLSKEPTPP